MPARAAARSPLGEGAPWLRVVWRAVPGRSLATGLYGLRADADLIDGNAPYNRTFDRRLQDPRSCRTFRRPENGCHWVESRRSDDGNISSASYPYD